MGVEVRSNMQANCLMSRVTALMAVLAIWYVPEANSQESMRKWSPHRGFQENASTPVQSESPELLWRVPESTRADDRTPAKRELRKKRTPEDNLGSPPPITEGRVGRKKRGIVRERLVQNENLGGTTRAKPTHWGRWGTSEISMPPGRKYYRPTPWMIKRRNLEEKKRKRRARERRQRELHKMLSHW